MKIIGNLPIILPITRKASIAVGIVSVIALAIFYLYRALFSLQFKIPNLNLSRSFTDSKNSLKKITNMDLINANQQALKTNSFFIKLLFCGTPERQKIAAEKMAQELNIPFHYFDGREDNHKKLHSLLKRIDLSTGKEFVFVSSADKIDRSQLETILGHTGSVSKKLLLCIGASSQNQLDPALISRYGFIIQA